MLSDLLTTDEAERQLLAASERHREMLASVQERGRPETGQHIAVKAVERAVSLVCFALGRAAAAGIPMERLVELTGWEPALVSEGLGQVDDPQFIAHLVPAGLDAGQVAQTAATVSATARLDDLTHEILDHVLDEDRWVPSPEELDALCDRLTAVWTAWLARPRSATTPFEPTDAVPS